MISPISFKGTYKIDFAENKKNSDSVWDIENKLIQTGRDYRVYTHYPESEQDSFKLTFVTDDNFDKHIEKYMMSKGINFRKINNEELFKKENIKSRIVMPEYRRSSEFRIVEIDTDRFNAAYKKYGNAYVGDKDNIAFPQRYQEVEEYLKSGEKIDASEIYITDRGTFPEIDFQDGRHRYAYYRDIGMKEIPVAMNQESIKTAEKYGLLAN